MAFSKPKIRRASGTRTMPDVLRNFFRPPTIAQKKADVEFLHSGGELIVAAMLTSARSHSGIHWAPQGHLHLTNEKITWKSSHKLPDLTFSKDEWIVRNTPVERTVPKLVIVSLVNQRDRGVHHELHIPGPDLDLVLAAFSGA